MADNVRIDKWLWAARFFKTRSLATTAVDNGKVRVDGERVKPARPIRLGEKIEIDNGSDEWTVLVEGISDVRGSAPVAQRLYSETPDSIARREQRKERNKLFREPAEAFKGRPTKRDRRQMDNLS
ncbi:MAG TPA: S4 domain-containing protein [Burkholderiaceae bacterium]